MVVYHLPVHGQTGRFTVWVNAKKKFRTGKFPPGSHFSYEGHPHLSPLNRIALIYFNIA